MHGVTMKTTGICYIFNVVTFASKGQLQAGGEIYMHGYVYIRN